MNEVFPRCAVPGSSCRLLQLEAPGARPVWAVLDAAGTRHFTGEITLHCAPTVRAWFNGGELYFAERDGDPGLAERLLAMGVLSADDLAAGSVQLGALTHLGRLFDRVPHLDRDHVELALEILTGEVVGEIADHVVEEITIASYRHHPSGVVKWQKRPTVVITQVAGDVDPSAAASAPSSVVAAPRHEPVPFAEPSDLTPSAEDEALVAEYEASRALIESALIESAVLESAVLESEEPNHEIDAPVDEHAPGPDLAADLDQEHIQEHIQEHEAVVEGPSTAATREQPVFDDLLLEPEPVAVIDLVEQEIQPENQPGIQPGIQPDAELPVRTDTDTDTDTNTEIRTEAALDRSVETPFTPAIDESDETHHESHHEAPVEAEDALAAFERSLNAQLDATFAQHFDQHFDQHLPSADAPQLPVLEQPVLEQPVLEPPSIVEQSDQHDRSEPAVDAPALTEQTWAIDDRMDWHVDTPAPATVTASSALSALSDGPVVEFDLQHLLQQHDADRASGSMTIAGVEVPEETDADIRAAVQAALAEIAAATRPGGDHEVPSILMQAALVADAETGLTPSPDLWDVAAPTASTPPPPPPPTAARPVVPILPDRAPSASPLPSIPPAMPTSTVTDADEAAPAASEGSEPARAEEPVAPPTGGLRRLMGSRKP